jgi:3-oxoacyl-[acyl-carrier protein] reductase|tara:strand:+ start:61 stop:807 length:747 start_codon:yes stop_codon:yes gene_type:complete
MSRVFKDRVAMITGASQGIGESIAQRLASEGCNLILASRRQEACEEVGSLLAGEDIKTLAVGMDVGNLDSVMASVDEALERFGHIDFLVNNAGIARDNLLVRMDPADWDAVLRTDLTGVYNCTKTVLRSMLRRRSGRVVTISSVVGLLGNSGQTAYGAAKAGVLGFTKSLAREIASRNITVNAVAPGYISTEMTAGLPEGATENLQQKIPLGRFGVGADVAGAVRFLLSEDAAYITGQILSVDGGMYM